MLCVDLDGRPSIDEPAGHFTYQWHMGDGTTLTDPTVSYCYKERKNYVVELDVIVDKTGEVRRSQKYIPINLVEQDIVDFTPSASRVRVGESVSFTTPESQLLTCQNVQLVWDFRDGAVVQGRTALHVFRRPGTYSVRFNIRGYGSNACVASHCVNREVVVEP
jgi:PKD repeat protein